MKLDGQPGTRPGGTCANRAEVRSRRRAPRQPVAATRHARGRSARRPAPSVGAPAADHAAALWQLCCAALVTTTTVACPVIGSRARCHRVQMATMAERGANAGTARRARDGRRAHPAIRHRVCIRTRSGVRRLTILVPIGAGFGHGTRTRTLSRTLTGREASKCAVRPQSAARADHLSRSPGAHITTTGSPKSADSPLGSSAPALADNTAVSSCGCCCYEARDLGCSYPCES
jgi:hypothetical protein